MLLAQGGVAHFAAYVEQSHFQGGTAYATPRCEPQGLSGNS
jgi:hypothetical protein